MNKIIIIGRETVCKDDSILIILARKIAFFLFFFNCHFPRKYAYNIILYIMYNLNYTYAQFNIYLERLRNFKDHA